MEPLCLQSVVTLGIITWLSPLSAGLSAPFQGYSLVGQIVLCSQKQSFKGRKAVGSDALKGIPEKSLLATTWPVGFPAARPPLSRISVVCVLWEFTLPICWLGWNIAMARAPTTLLYIHLVITTIYLLILPSVTLAQQTWVQVDDANAAIQYTGSWRQGPCDGCLSPNLANVYNTTWHE